MTLHIKWGPSFILAAWPAGLRYCFGCRKHLAHTWRVVADPPELQPSYYEPVPLLRCSRCHRDRTSFPGLDIDGPRYPDTEAGVKLSHGIRETWSGIDRRGEINRGPSQADRGVRTEFAPAPSTTTSRST